jgi:GAF domain-containing protein
MTNPLGSPDPAPATVAEAFVELADTLVDDFDVVELMHRLAVASVALLGNNQAGILLDDQQGHLGLVASSSEETRVLELYQLQNDQGPCLDCIRTASMVVAPDLQAESERWPLFVPAAREAGFCAVMAVPLRLRDVTIGAMNLFRAEPHDPTIEERRLAQAFADIATIGILQQRSLHRSSILAEQLQQALNSRVIIEQAKGVLAERHSVTMDLAFESLRRHARNSNLKLGAAALSIVAGELEPD